MGEKGKMIGGKVSDKSPGCLRGTFRLIGDFSTCFGTIDFGDRKRIDGQF